MNASCGWCFAPCCASMCAFYPRFSDSMLSLFSLRDFSSTTVYRLDPERFIFDLGLLMVTILFLFKIILYKESFIWSEILDPCSA